MGVWEWIAQRVHAAFLEGVRRAKDDIERAEFTIEPAPLALDSPKQLEAEPAKRRNGR